MLINRADIDDKLHSDKIVIGYELGEKVSQISYCYMNKSEPETLSSVAGEEQFNIPTALCKRYGVGQWFYGKEALKHSELNEGVLVENLLQLARKGDKVSVEDTE